MKKVKIKFKNIIVFLFIILCLFGIIYSSYNILKWYKDVNANKDIKDKIDDNIKKDKDNNYKIDFKKLKEQNSDTIAYLVVPGTNIDYVVVQGKDNDYYLKHNFNKEYNVAGWIFADFHNRFDDTDKNIVIYGHNTKDESMFETLINVLNKDWYENKNNHIITLITEKGTYKYQVFSTYDIVPEDYYINTEFKNTDEFNRFISVIKSRSKYDYKVDINGEDKVLTLSSCIGDGKKRVVLHSKLIEVKNNE